MQSSNLHQANALVGRLKNSVESTVAASIKRHVANSTFNTNGNQRTINNSTNLPPQLQNLPPGYSDQEISPEHVANAARMTQEATPDWQVAMQSYFDKMDACLKDQESALKDINNGGGGGGNFNGYCKGGNNYDYCGAGGGYCKRKNVSKYCWTQGVCSHDSSSCNNKAPGHQNNATFQNKLGGSTRFCNPQE